jgi:type VI secretion system protein ImpJ
MHLSVHHFQAQNRYFEESIQFATSSLWTAPYGLMNCELSPDAIQNGRVSLLSAAGVLKDGLVFSIPDPDILPERDSELDVAPLMHETEHSLVVFLCTPKYKNDGGNCALETTDGDVRYRAQTLLWHDENTGRDEKELQLGHKNLKLYAGKPPAGHEGIPIARVLRVGTGFGYDPAFIPPCLHISGSKALKTMAEQLVKRLDEKGKVLNVYSESRTSGRSGFSRGEVSGFWFLNAVNSHLPTLRHLSDLGKFHPEVLYSAMLKLAGALCTFSLDGKPAELPLYDHDRLTECFAALNKHIQVNLDYVVPPNCVSIPLRTFNNYYHANRIEDERCFEPSRWILSVRADMGEADLVARGPSLIKVSSAQRIQTVVNDSLPGLALTHLPSPPVSVGTSIGSQYFKIDKSGQDWEDILKSKTIGIFAPSKIPGAKVEVLVILQGESQ